MCILVDPPDEPGPVVDGAGEVASNDEVKLEGVAGVMVVRTGWWDQGGWYQGLENVRPLGLDVVNFESEVRGRPLFWLAILWRRYWAGRGAHQMV